MVGGSDGGSLCDRLECSAHEGATEQAPGEPPKAGEEQRPAAGEDSRQGLTSQPYTSQTQHLVQTIEQLEKELEKERLMQLIEEDTGEPWYPRQGSLPDSMWDAMPLEGSVGNKDP
jgi:hypothetical protein